MPLNKTACRRSARVATRATAAANNRTKASLSTTPGKTSKTSRLQAQKPANDGKRPRVPRQMLRRQEESEWEEWDRENVSSDEVVENTADPVSSDQGRERQSALRGRDETMGGDSLDYFPVPSRNARTHQDGKNKEQPLGTPRARTRREPTASGWRAASEDEA